MTRNGIKFTQNNNSNDLQSLGLPNKLKEPPVLIQSRNLCDHFDVSYKSCSVFKQPFCVL